MSLNAIAGLPVKRVSEQPFHVNMMIYGESGVGKTTLSGSSDAVPEMRKVLVLDIEGGLLSLKSSYPNVDAVRIRSWVDMQSVYDELSSGNHGYNTIVVDSLTEAQKMCYSSDTEVLTPKGWKTIPELADEVDLIAQYQMGTELISFVQPYSIMSYHHHGPMVSIPTASSALLITDNHRVLTSTRAGTISVRKAEDLRVGLRLPTAGTLLSISGPTPEQARLLVAWAADGHRNVKGMKFHLKKQEKIERLKKLIVDCGLQYDIPDWKDEGTYIIVKDSWSVTKFMPDRLWKSEYLFWSLQSRDAMMSEMPYWDSTPQPSGSGSFCYRTSYKSNADAISAIAALTGWSVSISIDHPRDPIYRVNLVRSSWRTLTKLEEIDYNDKVWCVSVPSGFIVTRRNGKVTICGNSMDEVMRRLIREHEERDADVPGIREWNINIEQTRKFVRALRDLPLNTIFTALAKTDKNQRTGASKTKPSLSGKVADEVAGFLDIVAYLYTKEVDGEQTRMLLCGATQDNVAKDRTSRLEQVMQKPTMSDIWNTIKGLNENDSATQG
jgi:hypothetical protein